MTERGERVYLHVFYTIVPEATVNTWRYDWDTMPNDWTWVGGGSMTPTFSRDPITVVPLYQSEEQFAGSVETRELMRECLVKKFEQLKRANVVSCYSIAKAIISNPDTQVVLPDETS